MYLELTPEDTIKSLQQTLIDAIPNFEYPRQNLYDYHIQTITIDENGIQPGDFVIGVVWEELPDTLEALPRVLIERSYFGCDLTEEEIDILAVLMMCSWLQRQVTSVENIRMKYSGADFKMTSQANHLSKLLALQTECRRQSHHKQRLYKRRELMSDNRYRSTWYKFGENHAT